MRINKEFFDKYLFNKYSLTIGGFILWLSFIGLNNLYNGYYEKKEREEYKVNIVHTKLELKGYVIDYSISKVFSGTRLTTLSTGDKFFVSTTPYDLNGYSLLSCLSKGDYLYKPANTDSIFVTKPDGTKCFFMAYWKTRK